ncbi:MAG: hypothetical protein K2L21_06575 [Muribaculaceae bacterium]|nr:hypothetical protein [Muribaculaceae bacterium]
MQYSRSCVLLFLLLNYVANVLANEPESRILKDLGKYAHSSIQSHLSKQYWDKFVGDTITLNFPDEEYLNVFRVATPDTVWIKKRPKKNPEIYKHYVLNRSYKGVEIDGQYATPASEINGKEFVVYRVTSNNNSSNEIIVSLLDLETIELIDFHINDYYRKQFLLNSARAQKIVDELIGDSIYYYLGKGAIKKAEGFRKAKVIDGGFSFSIVPTGPAYSKDF